MSGNDKTVQDEATRRRIQDLLVEGIDYEGAAVATGVPEADVRALGQDPDFVTSVREARVAARDAELPPESQVATPAEALASAVGAIHTDWDCAVCRSPWRVNVEWWRAVTGGSFQDIVSWLPARERLSTDALELHFADHHMFLSATSYQMVAAVIDAEGEIDHHAVYELHAQDVAWFVEQHAWRDHLIAGFGGLELLHEVESPVAQAR